MVRCTIPTKYISDQRNRKATFKKRTIGLLKKAYELATLSGTNLELLFTDFKDKTKIHKFSCNNSDVDIDNIINSDELDKFTICQYLPEKYPYEQRIDETKEPEKPWNFHYCEFLNKREPKFPLSDSENISSKKIKSNDPKLAKKKARMSLKIQSIQDNSNKNAFLEKSYGYAFRDFYDVLDNHVDKFVSSYGVNEGSVTLLMLKSLIDSYTNIDKQVEGSNGYKINKLLNKIEEGELSLMFAPIIKQFTHQSNNDYKLTFSGIFKNIDLLLDYMLCVIQSGKPLQPATAKVIQRIEETSNNYLNGKMDINQSEPKVYDIKVLIKNSIFAFCELKRSYNSNLRSNNGMDDKEKNQVLINNLKEYVNKSIELFSTQTNTPLKRPSISNYIPEKVVSQPIISGNVPYFPNPERNENARRNFINPTIFPKKLQTVNNIEFVNQTQNVNHADTIANSTLTSEQQYNQFNFANTNVPANAPLTLLKDHVSPLAYLNQASPTAELYSPMIRNFEPVMLQNLYMNAEQYNTEQKPLNYTVDDNPHINREFQLVHGQMKINNDTFLDLQENNNNQQMHYAKPNNNNSRSLGFDANRK